MAMIPGYCPYVAAAVPTIMAAAAWAAHNSNYIYQGAGAISTVKDCVLNGKMNNARSQALTTQLFEDANNRTDLIWSNLHPKLKKDMESRITPLRLSLENIPKTAGDLANWVKEAVDCNVARDECFQKRDEHYVNWKIVAKEFKLDKDQHTREKEPLIERKGQCYDHDSIKLENKLLDAQVKQLTQEKADLQAKVTYYEKWFFTRLMGL